MMQSLPIDSVLCWCPSWDEIKDKAHLYATARIRATGQCVEILYVVQGFLTTGQAFFGCRVGANDAQAFTTEELCDFCL